MRKIREILRLRGAGKSQHLVALSVGIGQSTVGDYLTRARLAGVSWPTPLDDEALERALYPPRPAVPSAERGEPDWAEVHCELKRKGVTLFLLWEEYKSTHPNGFQYSWFYQRYRAYAGKLDLVMRQTHRAGETMFVDYAGQTVPVVNRDTGELREAQIFVAVLGASSYTFARASWTHDALLLSVLCPVANSALGMGEHRARQRVPCLALAQARLTLHAQLRILDPVEHEQRALDVSDFAERGVEPVLLTIGAELAQHRRCFQGQGFDTGSEPQHVAPVLEHDLLVDGATHECGQRAPSAGPAEAGQPTVGEVAQARGERQTEQMEQGEHMVRRAASIDIVHERVELGRVAHESVEHKGGFARRGADHIGVERPVTPREEGVDLQAGVGAVLGVDLAGVASGGEELTVR